MGMCVLCGLSGIPEEIDMANVWSDLKNEVLGSLMEGLGELKDELTTESKRFFDQVAERVAKEKWYEIHASTDAERDLARSNLAHYKGQAIGEAALLTLRSGDRGRDIVKAALSAGLSILQAVRPSILGL